MSSLGNMYALRAITESLRRFWGPAKEEQCSEVDLALSHQEDLNPTYRSSVDPEWDVMRGRIVQLYIEENRRLEEVRAIISNEFAVPISKGQLKSRLSKWQIYKNIRKAEMVKILSCSNSEGAVSHLPGGRQVSSRQKARARRRYRSETSTERRGDQEQMSISLTSNEDESATSPTRKNPIGHTDTIDHEMQSKISRADHRQRTGATMSPHYKAKPREPIVHHRSTESKILEHQATKWLWASHIENSLGVPMEPQCLAGIGTELDSWTSPTWQWRPEEFSALGFVDVNRGHGSVHFSGEQTPPCELNHVPITSLEYISECNENWNRFHGESGEICCSEDPQLLLRKPFLVDLLLAVMKHKAMVWHHDITTWEFASSSIISTYSTYLDALWLAQPVTADSNWTLVLAIAIWMFLRPIAFRSIRNVLRKRLALAAGIYGSRGPGHPKRSFKTDANFLCRLGDIMEAYRAQNPHGVDTHVNHAGSIYSSIIAVQLQPDAFVDAIFDFVRDMVDHAAYKDDSPCFLRASICITHNTPENVLSARLNFYRHADGTEEVMIDWSFGRHARVCQENRSTNS